MLEDILEHLENLDNRLDKLEKKISAPNHSDEIRELKVDLKQNHDFMRELVLNLANASVTKANKPSAAELYAASKNNGVANNNAINNNIKSPKELSREVRRLPLP